MKERRHIFIHKEHVVFFLPVFQIIIVGSQRLQFIKSNDLTIRRILFRVDSRFPYLLNTGNIKAENFITLSLLKNCLHDHTRLKVGTERMLQCTTE
jgi:hypothetical protein